MIAQPSQIVTYKKYIILASLFFLLYPLHLSFAETPRQKIFQELFHKFMGKAEGGTYKSWVTLGDAAFSETLTLKASEMIRAGFRQDISRGIYAEILQTVRARLAALVRRPTFEKGVTEKIEKESGKNLEALYEEMVDIFKSPDDLVRFIEANRWAREAISAQDYHLLKTVAYGYQHSVCPAYDLVCLFEGQAAGNEKAIIGKLRAFIERERLQVASVSDIVALSKKHLWETRGILSAAELEFLQKLPPITISRSYNMINLAEQSERSTFRNLTALRQDQLFSEAMAFTEKAAQGALPDEKMVEAIFRNLSEQNNFLWSYAQARLAMTVGFQLTRLSRHPSLSHLSPRWFDLRRRSRTLLLPRRLLPYEAKFSRHRWLLGTARVPYGYRLVNDPQAISEFFRELTALLSEVEHAAPKFFSPFTPLESVKNIFSLPHYIRKSIEHRAKILAAEFDLLKGLRNLSPEFENAVLAKQMETLYMQRYFEVYEREGLPALIKAVAEVEGGYHPIGWKFKLPDSKLRALLTFWFPWTYKYGDRLRGQYFRKWTLHHGMTLFLVLLISGGETGEEEGTLPYVPDAYSRDRYAREHAEHGGIPPEPPQYAGRVSLEFTISQKLKEKKGLILEFEGLKAIENQDKASKLSEKIESLDEELAEFKEGLKEVIQISEPKIQPLASEIERLGEEIIRLTELYDLSTDENEKRSLRRQTTEIDKKIESYQQEIENILTKKVDEIFQQLERQ